ncbi:DUF3613 domain-containing protein [Paraburkholderia sp. IW21]|uniref:DUF3613 domain-containing protein n=1 Tax=Paraburkholderia sp. IW21 TaxID=3242488 RepID=UPI0035214FD3
MKNGIRKRNWVASTLCIGALLGASASAVAQTGEALEPARAAPRSVRASEVGRSTRAWLDLQSSNTQAAPELPMLGAEAGLAYRRYMESFRSRIPELYGSTLNNSGAGSSGGAGSAPGGLAGAN